MGQLDDELGAVTGEHVLGEQHRSLLSSDAWELGEFEREHLAEYLQRIAATRRAP